jgi:hypothetical protein
LFRLDEIIDLVGGGDDNIVRHEKNRGKNG